MRSSTKIISIGVTGILVATVASVALLTTHGSEVRAQAPLAPCVCSRATPVVGTDEVAGVPGPLQARFGMVHCQCGAATCVSQIPFGSAGPGQLYCVK